MNRKKCQFLAPEVTYLGYCIDKEGLHPTDDKLRAVRAAPEPTNVTELKSYLGLLTYYGRFLPHLPSTLAPLYSLLRQGVEWKWDLKEQEAFQKSKDLLLSSKVLVHFDPKLPVVLACDASSYGIGAVLAHKLPDGTEKPIGFASRTLSPAEKQYSQIEKEGLSCVFGVRRFHAYLIGRHFSLITDHKPLLSISGTQVDTKSCFGTYSEVGTYTSSLRIHIHSSQHYGTCQCRCVKQTPSDRDNPDNACTSRNDFVYRSLQ